MHNVRVSWRAHKFKFFPLKFDVSVGLETAKPKAVGQTQRAQNANLAVSKFLGVTATNGLNKNLQDASQCCTCEQDTCPKKIFSKLATLWAKIRSAGINYLTKSLCVRFETQEI